MCFTSIFFLAVQLLPRNTIPPCYAMLEISNNTDHRERFIDMQYTRYRKGFIITMISDNNDRRVVMITQIIPSPKAEKHV